MCDYSLMHVKRRDAKVADKLVTHDFTTGTSGFKAVNDPGAASGATAICVLPGTELSFAESIRTRSIGPYQADVNGKKQTIGVPPKSAERTATFIQVDKELANRHHDALQFADGNIVLLTSLQPGQEATVLTLPAAPRTPVEKKAQERAFSY